MQFYVGPTKDIINDFWRMIWQEDIGKIVMLTNLEEENKVFVLNIHYIIKLHLSYLIYCHLKQTQLLCVLGNAVCQQAVPYLSDD